MDFAQVVSSVSGAWKAPAGTTPQGPAEGLPDPAVLNVLVATAFEASLLREENRPLVFRLILRSPEYFPEQAGPPVGLQRLVFEESRPFTAQELRRLTPAVDYEHSLVGIREEGGRLWIWGIVQSGRQWLEQFHGGRGNASILPDCLILGVRDPGYMVISQGSRPLCALEGGALQENRLNVFKSQWLSARFEAFANELMQLHAAARAKSEGNWSMIQPDFTRMIAQQMIQRLISTVQRTRHGGTLLIVPAHRAYEITHGNAWIKLKYTFKDEEPRARFRSLVVEAMNTLAASGAGRQRGGHGVGWDDYGRAEDRNVSNLDEGIFEISHMLATLTAVDGAVVVTKRFELLGFGGEIAGTLAEVPLVARSLDLEGLTYGVESTEDVGTRHRSVYRLCNVLHDILGIVVSQDGSARFVRWNGSQVMYWNHNTITPGPA